MTNFYGKYRGKVENNIDPKRMGRIQVSVPAVTGAGRLSWAMPCAPYAGKGVGFVAIPPISANVWVEFEGGNPDFPIWSGCFWGVGEMPVEASTPQTYLFKTAEVSVKMLDVPGAAGFSVETLAGMKIEIGPEGVSVDNGQGSSITISPEGVEIKQSQGSTVKLGPQGIQIDNGQGGAIELAPQGIQIDNGKGGTIDLEGPKVAINKSALEVT